MSSEIQQKNLIENEKNNIYFEPIISTRINDAAERIEKYEPYIINFIDFLKKDLLEKEKQQNLFNYYESKTKDFKDDDKKEINIKKKNFDAKFSEISSIKEKIKEELNIDLLEQENYHQLIKNAKDDLRCTNLNKNEKAGISLNLKSAIAKFKKLEIKINTYTEVLKRALTVIGNDKIVLLEEELKVLVSKISEEFPILESMYLKNIQTQVKIFSETSRKILNNEPNKHVPCPLKDIFQNMILFLNEMKKKIIKIKGSKFHNVIKDKIERLNSKTNNVILKIDEIKFLNFTKSDELKNFFNLFNLTMQQNTILLLKILNIAEFFYSRKLTSVFENKLKNIKKSNYKENLYYRKYGEKRNRKKYQSNKNDDSYKEKKDTENTNNVNSDNNLNHVSESSQRIFSN